MASRNEPKKAIGTVNSSEFFVTLASSITFFILVSDIGRYIPVIAGLIIGGVIAAPIAAKLCMKANEQLLYAGTGALLMFLNICNIINYFQV